MARQIRTGGVEGLQGELQEPCGPKNPTLGDVCPGGSCLRARSWRGFFVSLKGGSTDPEEQVQEVNALPAPLVASLRPRQCGMRIRLQVQNESESEGS